MSRQSPLDDVGVYRCARSRVAANVEFGMASLSIRAATPDDIPLILALIRELAEYEKAPHEAKATPELLQRALFPDPPALPHAECLIGELDGQPQGLALFF